MELNKIMSNSVNLLLLAGIIYLSVSTRLSTLASPTVLDYDPFYFYRHSLEILENNMVPYKWDLLSFYPPGRPFERFLGWEYTMIAIFKIISFFVRTTFVEVAKLAPVIIVALATIPAFFLGRFLSNKWGGLATALFATLTPTLIGVSMAGYCDTDAIVVFYFFLSVYSILLALKKRSIPFYIFAILVNLAFVYNWGAGWLPLMLFIALIPGMFVFRLLEDIVYQRKLKLDLRKVWDEMKPLLIPLLIISLVTNVIGYLLGLGDCYSLL